jgi:hypothetical protein
MKVKFLHLESIIKAFKELNECRMSFATKIKLRDAQETLMKEAEWFEEQRLEIINRYARKGTDGKPVVENDNYILEDKDAFVQEFGELLNTEFEIKPIEATLVEHLEISGQAWDGLMHIIE